jgi:hypothetical protein
MRLGPGFAVLETLWGNNPGFALQVDFVPIWRRSLRPSQRDLKLAQSQPMIEKTKSGSCVGIALVGAFATIAGIGEIVVGLTGNYLGILAHSIPSATSAIIIGAFYSLGGLSILTIRKLGAALGIFFIACEVLGRLYLVMIGIAPSTGGDAIKIVIGGLIAVA